MNLHWVDAAVIGTYLALVAWIGVRAGRGVKRSADFFMPRNFKRLETKVYN